MDVPSKVSSRASVNCAVGSPRNRICRKHVRSEASLGEVAFKHLAVDVLATAFNISNLGVTQIKSHPQLTPELPEGSSVAPQALVLFNIRKVPRVQPPTLTRKDH